jgi:hypothetical protein
MTNAVWQSTSVSNSWLNADWVKNLQTIPQFPIPDERFGLSYYATAQYIGTLDEYLSGRAKVIPYTGATILRASWNAPMKNGDTGLYADDGVKGMITNTSTKPIMVEILPSSGIKGPLGIMQAILLPQDKMPYLFENALDDGLQSNNTLRFYRVDESTGQPVGQATTLWIDDGLFFDPDTRLTFANGVVNFREGWDEGEQHHEVWGATSVFIRRENQKPGWNVPSNPVWLAREYATDGTLNNLRTRDWAIYTVNINGLG